MQGPIANLEAHLSDPGTVNGCAHATACTAGPAVYEFANVASYI